jgi:outer membrane receptor protein involved in Fe transport
MVFDGPVKADVVFSYELPLTESQSVEFYGKVENVFDNDYYENGFGSPGVWAIGGMRFKF